MGVVRRIRLAAVLTHPVQYFAPWFRYIEKHAAELDLVVLYATRPSPEQQGAGFGHAFTWDVPLLDGYESRILSEPSTKLQLHAGGFRGMDVPEIAGAISDENPDVVLLPGWHSLTMVRARLACRRLGIPVLYRGDTHLGSAPRGWKRPLWRVRNRFLLGQFDGYLSVGRRAREMLLSLGASPCRIYASPHCVDNEFFARSAAPHQTPAGRFAARGAFGVASGDFVVLFVGKLDAKKRPLQLIEAVARMGPGASVLMVGAGPQEELCRAEALRLGVRVRWAGFLNQTEIARAYAAADCLALCSESETWGLVVNEAMATGLPCVVSDRVGCAPDLIVPRATGEIVPLDDVAALARALERLRTRHIEGHNFAPECRARIARYSFAPAMIGLVAACQDVVRRRPRSGRKRLLPQTARIIACCGNMVTVSGLERMTFEVLRGQRAVGAAVHCVVNSWENHRISALAESVGASWSVGSYYHTLFLRHSRNPMAFGLALWDIAKTSAGLLRDAVRFRPTHVFLPDSTAVLRNAPALLLLRLARVPVILRVGDVPVPGRFYRRIWRWGINPLVTRVIGNSRFTQAALLAHGIPLGKTGYIHNMVPVRAISGDAGIAERDPMRVIYVGLVIPRKGVDVLLDACGLLVARGRDVRLDIVGDMDGWESPFFAGYRRRVRERASRADLVDRVRFLGYREDVLSLLRSAAVHCCPTLPSGPEAFGVVNIEAKQAGIPTVCFRSGALPEIVEHRVNGWVCNDATVEELAAGLDYFLSDPDRREEAGRAARRDLSRFDPDAFYAAWHNVFAAAGMREAVATGVVERRPPL